MSVVSNRHNVVPFVAGTTKAYTGQRLAKIGYKKTDKIQNPLPSIAVSLPAITEFPENIIERALPYLVTLFENAQDGIIRSLNDSSGGTLTSVADSEVSLDACIAFMEAESQGSRLSKEMITSWFDSSLRDAVTVLIAEKLKFDDITAENQVIIDKHVNGYRELISSLAGGKTMLQPPQIRGCRNAIALADTDSDIATRLIARLDNMEKKPVIDALIDL